MQVRAVDFVAVPVTDMAKARAFYRDVLGLRELAFADAYAEYDAGNLALTLLPQEGAGSGVSVALAVPDVAEALAELSGRGVPVLAERREFPPCYLAAVADPFGNRILLHQRKDGTAG